MSFSLRSDPRRRTYVRLIGEIQQALNKALDEENIKRGLTQKEIAKVLGKNKSFVSRLFAGKSNMTLESLADLAYALDRPVKMALPSKDVPIGSNNAAPLNPKPSNHTPPPMKVGPEILAMSST